MAVQDRRKTGTEKTTPGSISSVKNKLKNLSESKSLENILKVRRYLLQFALTHSMEELLQATLDQLEKLTGSQIGFYHFLEADQKTLSSQTWSTRTLKRFCKAEGTSLHYNLSEAGVWVDCVRKRRPVVHNDYASLPDKKGLPPGHAALIRELVVPVLRGDRIMAILGVGNKAENYTDDDVETVAQLVDMVWDITECKRITEEFKNSEERFKLFFEKAPDAYFLSDLKGTFIDGNKQAEKTIGYRKSELIGKNYLKLKILTPGQMPKAAALLAINLLGRPTGPDRFVLNRKDGSQIPVEIRTQPIKIKGHTVVLGIARDITERHQAEETLNKANAQLAATLNALPDLLFETDRDGRIYDFRAPYSERLFTPPGQFLGKTVAEVLPPEAAQIILAAIADTVDHGHHAGAIYSLQMPSGLMWFELSVASKGDPHSSEARFIALARDITSEKQAEMILEESEKRYRELFNNASLAIFTSTVEGKVILVNPEFARMFGYKSPQDVIANVKNISLDCFADPNRRDEIRNLNAANPDLHTFENLYRRRDGSTFWGKLTVRQVMDPVNRVPTFEGFIEDIDDRKRAEEELRHRMDELERFNNLTVDRELRMVELKKEVNGLLLKAGEKEKYNIVE
jgi:PAS domain S-box-containing protein